MVRMVLIILGPKDPIAFRHYNKFITLALRLSYSNWGVMTLFMRKVVSLGLIESNGKAIRKVSESPL